MADERRANCIEHRKDTQSNTGDIDDLKKTVYGNGQPGLKERMTIMETNFSAVGKGINIVGAILGAMQILVGAAICLAMYFTRGH